MSLKFFDYLGLSSAAECHIFLRLSVPVSNSSKSKPIPTKENTITEPIAIYISPVEKRVIIPVNILNSIKPIDNA